MSSVNLPQDHNIFSKVSVNPPEADFHPIQRIMGVLQKYGFTAPQFLYGGVKGSFTLVKAMLLSADLVFHIPIYLIFNVAMANATQRIVIIQNRVTILLS